MKTISQPDPQDQIDLSVRAEKLDKLTNTPEWQELVAVMDERKEIHTKRMVKNMMRGYPYTEQDQLRFAGFWEGVNAVLKAPGLIEKRLERMLETIDDDAQQEGTDARSH